MTVSSSVSVVRRNPKPSSRAKLYDVESREVGFASLVPALSCSSQSQVRKMA